jgi:purine-nucleoside/S-methyl-5'-thioadenosine phosphorylase / adenosine deaminase
VLTARIGRVSIWCSDRRGGVSRAPYDSANVGDHVGDDPDAVAVNRQRLARTLGVTAPEAWVWLQQVHGSDIHVATAAPGTPPVADAAITRIPGLPLAILTADCAPVVVASADAVGVVHAGHRGLLAGVIESTVEQLRAIGHGAVRAYLGPCIRPEHYEFGGTDLEPLVARYGHAVASRTATGRPALDIPAGVRGALASVGVEDLDDSGVCTAATPELFSYRRDGVTGRQVTVAVLQ